MVVKDEEKEAKREKQNEKMRRYCWRVRHFHFIKKKKIVFSQFGGNGYGCNPKAIADEILRRGLDWDLVWLLKRGTDPAKAGIPAGIRPIVADEESRNSLYELETARVWINNIHFQALIERGLVKRKGTVYINTFHGGISFKSQGNDRPNYAAKMKRMSRKVQNQLKDCEMVDYILSSSDFMTHPLQEFFHGHGEIMRIGDARNDIIIRGSEELRKKVRDFYGLAPETKILLYAPTFRDNGKTDCFDLDYERILSALEEQDGCHWVAFARMHPNLRKKAKKLIPQSDRILDASAYLDMQELVVASDIMVTDYSSSIADFMLSRKPGFMYAKDLDKYVETRGLNFALEDLPFPIARNNDEMVDNILNFSQKDYEEHVQRFIDQTGYIDDGKASERIVDFLETIIEPGKHRV